MGRSIATDTPAVLVAAVVSAAGVVLADVAPTGISGWDEVLAALFGFGIVAVGAEARRWSLYPPGLIGLLLSGFTVWAVFGALSLLIAVGSSQLQRRSRALNAVALGAALQALVRAPEIGFWGLNSLVVAAALIPTLVSALRTATAPRQRFIKAAAFVCVVASLVGAASFGLVLQRSRADVDQGIRLAEAGLDAARVGDQVRTQQVLAQARAALDRAGDTLGATVAAPARVFPVSSQNLRAARRSIAQAAAVATAAERAASSADVQDLRVAGGRIDLDLLGTTGQAIAETNRALFNARVDVGGIDRDWLVPQLIDGLADFDDALVEGLEEGRLAEQALTAVPEMLGASAPKRYLILLSTPAESRELGGFVGAFALVEASGGQISLIDANPISSLFSETTQVDQVDLSTWFAGYDVAQFPQNLTGSVDTVEVFRAARDVFPELAGEPINGIVYLDPHGIGAFVDMLGSVELAELDGRQLNREETVEFLLRGQYLEFTNAAERKDFLVTVLERVFLDVIAAELPGPETLGRIFGPVARGGNLAVATDDDEANQFLRSVFLLRDFPANDGSDFLSVVQADGSASKLDAYLQREVAYDVEVDPTSGALGGKVTVRLQSSSSPDLPAYVTGFGFDDVNPDLQNGWHRILLSVFTPHQVAEVRVNGDSTPRSVFNELGYQRALLSVEVPPGGEAVVEFDVLGRILPGNYTLTLANQPLSFNDQMAVSVTPTDEWSLDGLAKGETVVREFELKEDMELVFSASR